MSSKIRPLKDRVVVERQERETKSAGGILIPDTAAEKSTWGKVVAVGPGTTLENGTKCAVDVKVGDIVLFGKYSGTEIKIDGKEYVILREDDIMGVNE